MKKVIERISVFVVASAFLLGVLIVGNTDTNKNVLTSTTINGIEIESLDNKKIGWGIKRNDNHEQPDVGNVNRKILDKYQGLYMGNKEQKLVYLTFDLGYEAGYTPKILEVLKQNEVKATFFITAHYVNTQPDLVKQMIDEGHIIGNHTVNHKSMPSCSLETIKKEVMDLHSAIYDKFGYEMKFIRPPKGEYSERTVAYTNTLGYTSVMWSFGYDDWDEKKQGREEYGKKKILDNVHNGEIMLLHATSKDNANILDDVIKEIKNMGYEFRNIDQFEK
ncbi:MAG: polysaccharide deacetylase family protein [Clostridium sp.]|jgi:polysaccharide deacetylase|nr:polysaccharide deacetylase family protein [Clostridium sp.]